MATGEELLVVDENERDREGMRALFDADGFVTTALGDVARAKELALKKFFAAAIVELDAGGPDAGLDLVRFLREHSHPTGVVVLSPRRTFDALRDALELGVVDVVLKRPDEVPRLRRAVSRAMDRAKMTDRDSGLVRDVRDVLEQSVRILVDLARRNHDADDTKAPVSKRVRMLLVDADPRFVERVAADLAKAPIDLAVEVSGGAALDRVTSERFDLVAVRNDLPDLPGSLVVQALAARRGDTLAWLYDSPGAASRLEHHEGGKLKDIDRPFRGVEHLVERVGQALTTLEATARDRRLLASLRTEHEAFLRRYSDVKSRIDALVR